MSAPAPARRKLSLGCAFRRQQGLSLIELLVAILIALFLIAGVIVVEQGVNLSYTQQNGLSQLQDEERFAMSVMASVVGTAGYYPNPTINNLVTALPAIGSFAAGQSIYAADGNSIQVRYMTAAGDGINLCDGTPAANTVYTSYLYVAADAHSGYDLYCQLNGGTPMALVNGLSGVATGMTVLYGIATGTDNNVTEYQTAAQVGNWSNVTSVQVTLTFVNPLATQSGQAVAGQPATVTFTRVISVMGRVGASG
ncbi:MAG: PilW family protein [Steroidobacteraceae bacterium]